MELITNTAPADLKPLLKLPKVLALIPVSKAGWWAGVASGRYPAPVRIGARSVAWRQQDIAALMASFGGDDRG